MISREAVVDFMTPLGLAHQMASNHHYGPGPWMHDQPAPLWNPTYYNRADANRIGFDRTATGSNAVAQYAPAVTSCWAKLDCVPDKYLLWFHHVPWSYRLRSDQTLWNALIDHYDRGVSTVGNMSRTWAELGRRVDAERHHPVMANLKQQLLEAEWWRDASIAYWQSLSKLPLPQGHRPPQHPLSWYESIHIDTLPGFLTPAAKYGSPCVPTEGVGPCVH